MLKKLIVLSVLCTLYFVLSTSSAKADDQILCPQPYGGAVVCGIETHVPVKTGIADNLPLVGITFIGASALVTFFSKKFNKAI